MRLIVAAPAALDHVPILNRRPMKHPRDSLPTLDKIEDALEATCGALITLESMHLDPADAIFDEDGLRSHVAEAVRALRHAIAELRLAHSTETSALALGFVLRGSADASGLARPADTYPKP
jgi:hypothetical protein